MSPHSRPTTLICKLCGGESAWTFQKRGFSVFKCKACGFLFVHPVPADGAADIYSKEYFRGAKLGFGYMNYEEDKMAMQPFFNRVLDYLEKFSPRRGLLLDVGAATGFFLRLARERGWKVTGVEVSEYAAKMAQRSGLDVHWGVLETAGFHDASFDAITLLDVLEHVADPGKVLSECWRVLRPGGIILINTPDTASSWAKLFGRRWHAFVPPEHLSYFNQKNLSRLMERHSFHIVATGKIAKRFTPAYIFSMLARWQKISWWAWLARKLDGRVLNAVAVPLDIRDNFFVIALKSDIVKRF